MEQRRSSASTPRQPGMLASLKTAAARLKGNIIALQYAVRDPRTPWYAKVVVGCVVAYAVSPIDLIPDVIPILGYLDDLLLVPLGIYLALKLISPEVLADGRAKAAMDATEEAIYNSMLRATDVTGNGRTVRALPVEALKTLLQKYGR